MTRVYESPRVTKPYTDEQWIEIEKLGHAIDADLKKGDVRLTMGGEPTFVSIDDPDGPEWNFTAVSHKKRILSGELIKHQPHAENLERDKHLVGQPGLAGEDGFSEFQLEALWREF